MATNKTIQPTGQVVEITALGDAPDISKVANAIDKTIDGVNALNSQIVVYTLGQFSTVSAFETALNTFVGSMPNTSSRNIRAEFTAVSSPFTSAIYIGTVTKTTDTRAQVTLHMHNGQSIMHGIQNSTEWSWDEYALKSQIGEIKYTEQYTDSARTMTFNLETGCAYLVCINKLNTSDANLASGLYLVQAHAANSTVRTVVASSAISSITVSQLTLTVAVNTTYCGVSLVRIGKY